MKQPNWTDLKARYLNTGRIAVEGVVLHDTAGSGTHGDTLYLANPSDGRKVSVDFTVERDGSIFKLNPDLDTYYTSHAGRNTRFKEMRNKDVTRATVGIEICQKADLSLVPTYPVAQVKAVAELCAWLVGKYKLTTSDVTTHRNVITDGSRTDPRRFPFEGEEGFWHFYWEAQGKGEEHATADVMPKIPDAEKPTYAVRSGDTLSSIAEKVLGKASRWSEIQQLNSLPGTTIVPGQILTMPAK